MGVGYNLSMSYVGPLPPPGTNPTQNSYQLNTNDRYYAQQFIGPGNGPTLNKVLVYVSAVAGTLSAGDLRCDIYSSSAGNPNASLANSTTVTSVPTGAGWVEFTGFNLALTGNTVYWIVVQNEAAVPGTNNFTVASVYYGPINAHVSGDLFYNVKGSSDAGSTWTGITARVRNVGWRLEFADGGFAGIPSATFVPWSGYDVYSNREVGAYFTTPSNGGLVVSGVSCFVDPVGSPTGGVRFRLYKGTTLVATTNVVANGELGDTEPVLAFFATSLELDPASVYRVVLAHGTTGDSSSNYYRLHFWSCQDSSQSRALWPLKGWQVTYTTDASASPPTFTETSTAVPPIALMLDADANLITGGASADYPAEDDVRYGVTYGDSVYTGTVVIPDEEDVLLDVVYDGGANEKTGTLVTTRDWTDTERQQIRYRLGLDGTTSIPAVNSPTLPVDVTRWAGWSVATPALNGVPVVDVKYVEGTALESSDTIDANVVSVAASGLQDFFNVDSGLAYSDAVAGSVVKEAADNAGGDGLTASAIWSYPGGRTLTALDENVTTVVLDSTVQMAVGLASANLDTQLADKTGYKLASDGLDAISTTDPTGVAANFREMMVQVWRRFFRRAVKTSTTLTTYADDGTTAVTTQTIGEDGGTETQGAATNG